MLTTAFAVLALAVALGTLLAVLHLREGKAPPPWPLGAVHGLIALAGFAFLALALRGPARGVDQGTAGFGATAAALFALAALVGAALLAARLRKRQMPGGLIALHAMVAVTGFVVLAAYYYAG